MERSNLQASINQILGDAKAAAKEMTEKEAAREYLKTKDVEKEKLSSEQKLAETQTEENKQKIAQAEDIAQATTKEEKEKLAKMEEPYTTEELPLAKERRLYLQQTYPFVKGYQAKITNAYTDKRLVKDFEAVEKELQDETQFKTKMNKAEKQAFSKYQLTMQQAEKITTKKQVESRETIFQGGE